MRAGLTLPMVLTVVLLAPAALAQAGRYDVSGSNPGGDGHYVGTMQVAETGDTFRVRWDTGGATVEGIGIRQGDVFAVAYGGDCGVVAYTPAAEGYEALWATMGGTHLGTERAEDDGEGRYRIAGTNPGTADVYRGTLVMGDAGNAAAFRWVVGGQTYDGLGLAVGRVYGATYGAPTCSIAVYDMRADGTLAGIWTGPGMVGAGTEIATPQR